MFDSAYFKMRQRGVAMMLYGACLAGAASGARAETNFLANPAFNQICTVAKGFTCISGLIGQGQGTSGAKDWSIYNTVNGDTEAVLAPSTLVKGGKMLHVTTTAGGNGVGQVTPPAPAGAYLCVWLKANSGAVSISAGTGVNASPAAILVNQGQWEVLNLGASGNPVTAVTIYSYGGAADFDIESARLSLSHSQCIPR